MMRFAVRLFGLALLAACPAAPNAWAQSEAGTLESRMMPNVTLPQTEWMKAEILGNSALEQSLRQVVDQQLRRRGYLLEAFSPYAVRLEIRGLGVEPRDPAIPQYSNPPQRLSLWNASTAADQVTVSLTLYHQSRGNIYWQAEATCRNIDAASVASAMVVPMMEKFGTSTKALLGCRRVS